MVCWLYAAGGAKFPHSQCTAYGRPAIQVAILLFLLPFSNARQNSTNRLRAHGLTVGKPNLLVLLVAQRAGCQCTFESQCSCQGALAFMDCVKSACNSGDCQCIDQDGTNHFLESCSAMADECPGTGLKCMQEQATCNDHGVAWHSKVKQHAVTDGWAATEVETAKADPAVADPTTADTTPKKYVLHTKYRAAVRALQSNGHRVFAQGIVITLVVLCMTIALVTNGNDNIATNTWSVIDSVVVTFLAFSWFIVVVHGLDYYKLWAIQKIVTHLVVSLLLLFASLLISWRLRSNDVSVDIFNGIFPMLVMWCNAGVVETAQKMWTGSMLHVFLALIVVAVWYAALTLFMHYVFSRFLTTRGWGHDTEDLASGGALACGFVLWCHMAISGRYYSLEGSHSNCPSLTAVAILNLLSFCFVGVSMVFTPMISRKSQTLTSSPVGSNGYWKLRMCGVGSWFLKFLPCFSFMLSLGHLVLGHMGYFHGSIGARLLLLLASITIAILMIILCTYVPFLRRDNDASRQLSALLLCLGGFMVGTAWSGLLDNSTNMMAKGKGYEDAFTAKLAIAGFLTVFIFPVYCWYLKPIMMRKAE